MQYQQGLGKNKSDGKDDITTSSFERAATLPATLLHNFPNAFPLPQMIT